MRLYHEDTIAAITTPLGHSSIGGIRVSGKDALLIVRKLFEPFSGEKRITSHKLYYGKLTFRKKCIDDITCVYMKGPHSYTAEDVVELFLHGNPIILQETLAALISNGARLAEGGEFTKRAFLNGRFDLVQAEGIAEIINAQNQAYLEVVQATRQGFLSSHIDRIINDILETLALIEANIEFPEDEIDPVYAKKCSTSASQIINELQKLIQNFESTRLLKDGIDVALIGKVNVGKSTLMNALLKKNRSITTDIPGTTRDVIIDTIAINGINFILHDTAGLRITENVIEQIGLQKTHECIDTADIVLFIVDASETLDEELFGKIKNNKKHIGALNKIDLAPKKEIAGFLKISAKNDLGIDVLKDRLYACAQELIPRSTYELVVNVRQKSLIEEAINSMKNAYALLEQNKELELIAFELKDALIKLEEIIGKKYSDDLLNTIFSKFCVGK